MDAELDRFRAALTRTLDDEKRKLESRLREDHEEALRALRASYGDRKAEEERRIKEQFERDVQRLRGNMEEDLGRVMGFQWAPKGTGIRSIIVEYYSNRYTPSALSLRPYLCIRAINDSHWKTRFRSGTSAGCCRTSTRRWTRRRGTSRRTGRPGWGKRKKMYL